MAANSFNFLAWLRENQKWMMAVFVVILVIVFVISTGSGVDPLVQWIGGLGGMAQRASVGDDTIAKWKFGDITRRDVMNMRFQRSLARHFLETAFAEVQEQSKLPIEPQGVSPIPRDDSELGVIRTMLFAKKAEQMGVVISDESVVDYISRFTGGKLSPGRIQPILYETARHLGRQATTAQLYAAIRQELLAQQMQAMVGTGMVPNGNPYASTPTTIWDYYSRAQRQMQIELINLKAESFLSQVKEPSDSDLRALYEKGKDRIAIPNSPEPGFHRQMALAFEWLYFDYKKMIAEAGKDVTDAQIAEYYEKNKELFKEIELPASMIPPVKKTEETKPEEKKGEEKKGEEKKTEEKKSDDKKTEEKKTEEKKSEEKKSEEKKPEEKKGEEKKSEEKKDEAPTDKKTSQLSPANVGLTPTVALAQADPAEKKAEEKKADEPKPVEKKSEEKKSEEKKTDEPKPVEKKTEEKKPEEKKTEEKKTDEPKPVVPAGPDPEGPGLAGPKLPDPIVPPTKPVDPPKKYLPLEKVKQQIRDILAKPKATLILNQKVDDVTEALLKFYNEYDEWKYSKKGEEPKPPSMADLAKKFGLESGKSELMDFFAASKLEVAKSHVPTGDGNRLSFVQVMYGERTAPLFNPKRFLADDDLEKSSTYVAWATAKRDSYLPDFKDVKDEVAKVWKLQQAFDLAMKEAEKIAADAKKRGGSLEDLKLPGIKVLKPAPFPWLITSFSQEKMLGSVEGTDGIGEPFMEAVYKLKNGDVTTASNQPKTEAYVVRMVSDSGLDDIARESFFQHVPRMSPTFLAASHNIELVQGWVADLEKEYDFKFVGNGASGE